MSSESGRDGMREDFQTFLKSLRESIRQDVGREINKLREDVTTVVNLLSDYDAGKFLTRSEQMGGQFSRNSTMKSSKSDVLALTPRSDMGMHASQNPRDIDFRGNSPNPKRASKVSFLNQEDYGGTESRTLYSYVKSEHNRDEAGTVSRPSMIAARPSVKKSTSLLTRTIHHTNPLKRKLMKRQVTRGLLTRKSTNTQEKPHRLVSVEEPVMEAEADTSSRTTILAEGYTPLTAPVPDAVGVFAEPPPVDLSHSDETSLPESLLQRIVVSHELEMLICVLLIFNAMLIGIEIEVHLRGGQSKIFASADTALGAIFAIELCLRICFFRGRFFFSNDWAWNLFDCAVVGQQVIDITLHLMELTHHKHIRMSYLRILRLARILRVTRILRLVRVVRFISELRTIANSVTASMKSLGWTLLLMFMVIYIVAVFLCGLVLEYSNDDESDPDGVQRLLHQYGSLPQTVLVLYESITGGLNWTNAVEPLAVEISPLLAVLFVLYIAFCVFCVMNVVTGVFCDKAAETAQMEKDEEIANLLAKIFEHIATDPNGKITFEDFKKKCDTEEMQHYFDALHIDIVESEFVFELIDVKGSGRIDPADFTNACLRLRGPAQAIELRMLMHAMVAVHESISAIDVQVGGIMNQLAGSNFGCADTP